MVFGWVRSIWVDINFNMFFCDLMVLIVEYFECKNLLGYVDFFFFKRFDFENWEIRLLYSFCY